MPILKILTIHNNEKTLRQKSEEIVIDKIISCEMQNFFKNLEKTMRASDGIGLAAPQVGRLIRVIAVNTLATSSSVNGDKTEIFINPKILKKSLLTSTMEEGCLSIPGIFGKVKRHRKILVEYLNKQGEKIRQKFDKMPARILQHEIDHLDGVLFIDRILK